MERKTTLWRLIFAGIFVLTVGCQTKTVEELAEKDSSKFLNNIGDSEKLSNHPAVLPVNMPEEIAEQNKAKSIKNLQDYFAELCNGSKDFKLIKSYRKYSDDNKKILFLEYEICEKGVLIMGYEVEENNVTLFSVWPKKKEDKPEVLFSDEIEW